MQIIANSIYTYIHVQYVQHIYVDLAGKSKNSLPMPNIRYVHNLRCVYVYCWMDSAIHKYTFATTTRVNGYVCGKNDNSKWFNESLAVKVKTCWKRWNEGTNTIKNFRKKQLFLTCGSKSSIFFRWFAIRQMYLYVYGARNFTLLC